MQRAGVAAAAAALGFLLITIVAEPGLADPVSPPFNASAEASGVNANFTAAGFPLTNTPLDSGGPTADAALNSTGTSTGYAAFPDPGQFVVSLPGLGAGLLSTGLAGLPPVDLPQPPSYPFEISTDAGTNPHQTVGSGPYQLDGDSQTTSSTVSATAGLQTEAVGNAALITSTAGVTVQSDGSVVATATSDVQGLTVGPLTMGEVTSTATETLGTDGSITPSTSLDISGVKLAGLPVAVSSTGLDVAGQSEALPLDSTLAQILAGAKIAITVVSSQSYAGRVVAPALEVTVPAAALPGVSSGPGDFTMTLGGASAAMAASAPAAGPGSNTSATPGSSGSAGSPVVAPMGSTPTGSTPTGSTPSGEPSVSPSPAAAEPASSGPPIAGSTGVLPSEVAAAPFVGRQIALRDDFDITSIYLILAGVALVMAAAGQLIRLLGVRGPWT